MPVPPSGETGCGAAVVDSNGADDLLGMALCPLVLYAPNQWGFVYRDGKYAFLPSTFVVTGIDAFDAVAAKDQASGPPAFRYRNGTETVLPNSEEVDDMNDDGGVAGSTGQDAAYWSPTNVLKILGPGFGLAVNQNATAVLGWQVPSNHALTTLYKVSSGQELDLTALGPQGFYAAPSFWGVNNKLHAIFDEQNTAPFPNYVTLPMFYNGSTVAGIPLLPGDQSGTGRGLSDQGVGVGFSCAGNLQTVCKPFVYYHGHTHDLSTLIPPGYDLTVNDAGGGFSDTQYQRSIAISDDGVIFLPAKRPGSRNNCGGNCTEILKLVPTANNPLPHRARCSIERS